MLVKFSLKTFDLIFFFFINNLHFCNVSVHFIKLVLVVLVCLLEFKCFLEDILAFILIQNVVFKAVERAIFCLWLLEFSILGQVGVIRYAEIFVVDFAYLTF